ncbi:MAG TPA: Ig-like domain repeat protein [Methanosphaera sp.]|nr:MAG: hypothetical protein BZ133_08570 [Methanosphaera sp. SHI613]HIH35784.1 Ig-like domain repeat protein [Methanosphaera sp.]
MKRDNAIVMLLPLIIILFISMSSVSAIENIGDMQSVNGDLIIGDDLDDLSDNLRLENNDILNEDERPTDIYVNNSREIDGDGLSFENASKHFNFNKVAVNGTLHLSEGVYGGVPYQDYNTHYRIVGQNGTIITSCSIERWGTYMNFNQSLTFINVRFEVPSKYQIQHVYGTDETGFYQNNTFYGISMDGYDLNFINCTFINTSFVSGQHQHIEPFRDGVTDVCTATFENCKFLNYTYDTTVKSYEITTSWGEVVSNKDFETTSMLTNFESSKYIFNNCVFDNITCDAIVDSYGGSIDNWGRFDGVYIYNSNFTNCNVNGIVKARQASSCEIINCTYDFPVSMDIPLTGPFYINRTADTPDIKTNLSVVANANSLLITLTDESGNPLKDYEVEIVINGKVSYDYTDKDGKIIINDLLGNYSFEISYPGDEYEGYAPSKVFGNFTFEKAKLGTALTAPKVSATYNVAKNLVVTLKDINGNVLTNKMVTVKVGTISKTLKTNAKGQVSVAVNTLVPKTYTASIKFAGDSAYKASSMTAIVLVAKAKPKLAAAKKTFKVKAKTKKVTATIKNNKGEVLKSTKLTLKVGKRTYTAKTNKKGVATFKVKLTKKGTYTGTVKFAGSKYFKALSKKVKIVVKK